MTNFRLFATTALAGASVFVAVPAWAQEVEEEQADQGQLDSEQEIESGEAATASDEVVVTGSRIRRPNLQSTVPVTSVGGEEFFESGQISVGDQLNELPALRSTFSQANSTRFLGTSGINLLDLRGLGTQRTLVLQNGRRHVAGDILNNAVSPDTNTFPSDLIERVDVVTGGNSAIYGSDAIAGVVNFVLKRDYDGVQLRGQSGISRYGDAGSYYGSLLAGKNFADGRGNIAINAEYARRDQYFGAGRPNLRQNNGFLVVDTDPAGSANGADGTPDRLFFRDIRNPGLTNTGVVRFGGNARLNGGTDPLGAFYNVPFAFDEAGNLAPLTGQRVGLGPNGSFIGGNGENFRGGEQFQVSPALDRYSFNVIGHLEIADAFEPFIEAKYVRTDSRGSGSGGPAFITGGTLGGDTREQIRLNNPFLSDQARALIAQQLTTNSATGTPPAANAIIPLRINLLGLGVRNEEAKRETYRIVGGIRGDFNDDWTYELSGNYGEFQEETQVGGNLNIQRFLLAADPIRAVDGRIVCRSQVNPDAAIPIVDNAAILAADVAACIPVNLFGGQFTQAQRDYLLADTTSVGKITQAVASGFLSGDLSQLFELPAGPIGFALGAEYRRETNSFRADPLVEQGFTFYNALAGFDPPAFEVKEAFGEVRIPLLKEQPFFEDLTLSAAGRIADYKGTTGTVYAYNVGLDYSPVQDIRFRANYSRAVRAPNLVELFSAAGQNFAGVVDPCSLRNIGTGSTNRAANCAAAGIPTNFDFVFSQTLEILTGGNPDLTEETSDSYTVGAVIQPRFIPGLSVTVDYFDITVDDVISSIAAQDILDQCYDQPTLDNVFCASFQRAGASGGPNGEEPFQIIEGSLLQSSLNFASLKVRGIDAEVAYRTRINDSISYNTRLSYTHNFQNSDFLNPAEPNRENANLLELGTPRDEFNWRNQLDLGVITLGYDLRYIGKQVLNAYEDVFELQGRPPENADYADRRFYPEVFYHDVRVSFDANEDFNFYLGIDNVLDRKPPLGLTGIGGGSGIYDVRGRFFYAGAVAKF